MITAFSAAFLGLASAYTQPVGDNPSGNPISKPGLGEIVPVGTPYTISWNPTTEGTVTIVLLRGPSTNVVPLYPIAEKIPNSGVYVWTPSNALEADTSRYGIQLIVDATGQFQYSTQFGIGNPNVASSSSASVSASSSAMAASTTSMTAVSQIGDGQIQAPASAISSAAASAGVPMNSANATVSMLSTSAYATTSVAATAAPYVASTGFPVSNSSIVQPTGSMTVPVTLQTSASGAGATGTAATSAPARATGAAGRVVLSAGGLFAGAGAVLALVM